MLDFRDDYTEMIREIHRAANIFRNEERPDWKKVKPWHVCFDVVSDKWWIDFFDADGHRHVASFETPIHADHSWYVQEIARQLGDN
jgi:hypothetical protein